MNPRVSALIDDPEPSVARATGGSRFLHEYDFATNLDQGQMREHRCHAETKQARDDHDRSFRHYAKFRR